VQSRQCKPTTSHPYSEPDLKAVKVAVEATIFPEATNAKKEDDNDPILYPECMTEFIRDRLTVWVKQAFKARFMPINEDFIISDDSRVISMDQDTGVEQRSMQFSLGLQQFLQLRFGGKMSPESLKCIFMSNINYFMPRQPKPYYPKLLYGITGTLGGTDEQHLLRKTYHVNFFGVPRYKLNKRVEDIAKGTASRSAFFAT